MVTTPARAEPLTVSAEPPRHGPAIILARRLLRSRGSVVGGIFTLLMVLLAVGAPLLAPYPPDKQNFVDYLEPPSAVHLFGTDEQGRDLFSRVLYGGQISLRIGLISVLISTVLGLVLGLLAGYFGGWVDTAISGAMDVVLAFPAILLALAVIAVLGPALTTVMVAVGISSVPHCTRVVRGTVLAAREFEYVTAARVLGCDAVRIMARHILPNAFAPVMVLATTGTAAAIITGAALSFLGFGVQPPTPEWGSMLSNGRSYLQHAPWLAAFPGAAIMVTVVAINLLGDGLRDAIDPRLN